nr:ROK family protein [Solobacterium sp.]
YGALKNVKNGVMLLILNTGIGGAVIHDGKIMDGAHFASGEVSYIRGDYRRRDEYNDMFALSCSIDGLSKAVEETSGKPNLNILRIMAKIATGDEDVKKGVENYCDRLALYMYNIQCVIDAEAFVIGGHLTDEPRTMAMIRQAVDRQFDADRYGNVFKPAIKECIFHNNSRMYGAVYNFRLQTGRIK